MKRAVIILLCGAALGLLAGAGVYAARTASHRAMLCCKQPEQAWLQHEFQLTDAQSARAQKLHDAYKVECDEMCDRIAATNELIRKQISTNDTVTPEMEKLLAGAAQMRVGCQTFMLQHFYAVSREMSPEQGKRYLAWAQEQILAMPREEPLQTSPPAAHGN